MTKPHHIAEWARVRETSLEIAEAIFELAHGDEALAQQIWEEGNDDVLPLAFAKTDQDQLYWGDETISRADV
ncbi:MULTISPECIES: YccJ family protein [Edwardsiella]|uniref:Uncharacterized protein n=2 Tax=Edwardsiella anguillarum TaxID=1821960 RepID=A0A076LT90_9GAMM|nr:MULTISPECIES: YccJ family protein [Edwardsiella]AKM48042.1 hypothetical protein QY76_12550 [Edwardsiella sp. EA181011]GAJ68378.1 putative cytoplasmic protein [Edwardsiella piscicida]AIJ09897.1 Hypothetical protein ETEE_3475 [Edwardsiella anguillarum ET080813]AKR77569.1 YccJ family protein [Edwardsiella sp. LADL05-105]KAB0589317.1 hypothetical protein F7P84_15155 [Edwardsiella anguillarum]